MDQPVASSLDHIPQPYGHNLNDQRVKEAEVVMMPALTEDALGILEKMDESPDRKAEILKEKRIRKKAERPIQNEMRNCKRKRH